MKKVRTYQQLKDHPASADVFKEHNGGHDDPDDIWVHLDHGWYNSEAGTHLFHEYGVKDTLEMFNSYCKPCEIEGCEHCPPEAKEAARKIYES